jgi:hypothetical protein
VIRSGNKVRETNTLLDGDKRQFRLDLERRELGLNFGGIRLLLGLLSDGVEGAVILS